MWNQTKIGGKNLLIFSRLWIGIGCIDWPNKKTCQGQHGPTGNFQTGHNDGLRKMKQKGVQGAGMSQVTIDKILCYEGEDAMISRCLETFDSAAQENLGLGFRLDIDSGIETWTSPILSQSSNHPRKIPRNRENIMVNLKIFHFQPKKCEPFIDQPETWSMGQTLRGEPQVDALSRIPTIIEIGS